MQSNQALLNNALYQTAVDNIKRRGYIVNSILAKIKRSKIGALISEF